jgi:hypothetical protein
MRVSSPYREAPAIVPGFSFCKGLLYRLTDCRFGQRRRKETVTVPVGGTAEPSFIAGLNRDLLTTSTIFSSRPIPGEFKIRTLVT